MSLIDTQKKRQNEKSFFTPRFSMPEEPEILLRSWEQAERYRNAFKKSLEKIEKENADGKEIPEDEEMESFWRYVS